MNQIQTYDVAITGGGLAGLSLSILLAREGFKVCLFEKETYPFHKVCGEYISLESWDFLSELGLPLEDWNLPRISHLNITAPNGEFLTATLPLGGFGISRYKLDAALADLSRKAGVDVFENTKVQDIYFDDDKHRIETGSEVIVAKVACACYGKKSNLDVRWKRHFLKNKRAKNFVGVKYHVSSLSPGHEITLYNFSGGYCGFSKIEDNRYCICYLTKSENLKNNRQSIKEMEENILKKNPALQKLFSETENLFPEPVTIAQISFARKSQIENHVLCIGDAAGMISPLCGNGMSMALHASKLAFEAITPFLKNESSRREMEQSYRKTWVSQFESRMKTGRFIQMFFGNTFLSTFLVRMLKPFPSLVRMIVRQTHGERF